jgi:2-iminoacetate synthase ThiH
MSNKHYYINEDGKVVFTKEYHLNRGYCCGSGCKHCPFEPKHIKGNTKYDEIDR